MYWKQFCYQILFILLIFFIPSLAWASQQTPPAVQNYAPNLWFSSGEKYYPVNPLDFYFENKQEIQGEKAVNKYNQLSLQEKLKKMNVLYHILDYGDEWVYQYWFFYVFNGSFGLVKNEHYGDWEAVYVYVDKASKKINKVIGTAHQRRFFDTELNYPKTNHIWSYIGNGSHANCVDQVDDGYCEFSRWRGFESWDKNGLKINHNHYNLIEINAYFIKQFNQLTSLVKSSELGINLAKFSDVINKEIYLPLGGSPPTHAWEQSSFYNPNELRPISRQLIGEYALNKYNQVKIAIKQTGSQIASFFNNLIAKTTQFLDQNNAYQTAGISASISNQISLTQTNFNQSKQENKPNQANLSPKTNTKSENEPKKTNQTEPKTEKNQTQKQNSIPKQIIEKKESNKEKQKSKQEQEEIIEKEVKIKKINSLPPGVGQIPSTGAPNQEVKKSKIEQDNIEQTDSKEESQENNQEEPGEQDSSEEQSEESGEDSDNEEPEEEQAEEEQEEENESESENQSDSEENQEENNQELEEAEEEQEKPEPEKSKDIIPPPQPEILFPQCGETYTLSDDINPKYPGLQIELSGIALESKSVSIFTVTESGGYGITFLVKNDNTWQHSITLRSGKNSISIQARDEAGNLSESVFCQVFYQTGSPDKITDLSAFSGAKRRSIDLTWTRPDQDIEIKKYLVKYSSSTIENKVDWENALLIEQNIIPADSGDQEDLSINDLIPGEEYCFAVKSIDNFGEVSEMSNRACAQASLTADNVVISEIQLDKKEFLELYNPTNQAIDMSDWYFAYYSANRDWNDPYRVKSFSEAATSTIPAYGYYLIDLSGDFRINGYIIPDWSVYNSPFLNNSKGAVGIFSGNPKGKDKSIDQVKKLKIDVLGWGNALVCEFVCAEPSSRNTSLRRNSFNLDKNNNLEEFSQTNWPILQNSLSDKIALISDDLEFNQDVVWPDGEYILESNANQFPTVAKGASLTIQPGAVIKGVNPNYPILLIKGSLQVQGSINNLVVFKGFSQGPFDSDWSGIVFDQAEDSSINHAHFMLAGSEAAYQGKMMEALRVIKTNLTVNNSLFRNINDSAIWAEDSGLKINNSIFQDIGSVGIGMEGGNLEVNNSVFEKSGDMGIALLNQAQAQINNNQFINNPWPVYLQSAYPEFQNNQVENNDLNGIIISSNSIFSQDWTWNNDLPYILFSNKGDYPTVATNTVLLLEPGTIVQAKSEFYTALLIQGELNAIGTAEDPILFQPYADEWKNIVFEAGSIGEIDYAEFDSADNPAIEIDANANVNLGGNVVYK